MVLQNNISDSAYMVNVSRNKSLELSQDIYSDLWIPKNQKKEVLELWNKYSKEVYPFDDIELGIRTSYFLNFLKDAIKNNPQTIFVNIGSGFTSYQYLIDGNFTTIEIDYKEMIKAKRSRAETLIKNKTLPERKTFYISSNLNDRLSRINAFKKIDKLINSKDTIVLCEGLFYYLSLEIVDKVINNISKLQQQGNLFAFDYWKPSLKDRKIYNGMIEFYLKEMGLKENTINLFYPSTVVNNNYFETIELTNVFEQELVLSNSKVLQKNIDICLEENYIKLKNKKASTQQYI